jgi:DNA invertase Pin-like site-specific DNA recombinase
MRKDFGKPCPSERSDEHPQRQRIAAYCTMKGLHLAEVFEDAAISAGKPLTSRPAGSQLLAAARKGKAVVVAKLDRLCGTSKINQPASQPLRATDASCQTNTLCKAVSA